MALSQPPPIAGAEVVAYRIPTATPESDGTHAWDATTLVLVRVNAGGEQGLGYTYADRGTAVLIQEQLLPLLGGADPTAIEGLWQTMVAALRNLGRTGTTAMAVSAVDSALWDLKAKLLGLSLTGLLGAVRDSVPVYGSGGFTSYSDAELAEQLGGWTAQGFRAVKMKIGRDPTRDDARMACARRAIGASTELFVDANGAYPRQQALAMAERMVQHGVSWYEEPVPATDLEGLRLLRDRSPAGLEISGGEYGYDPVYFRRMLDAQAVDVLQADVTRCGGVTGFLKTAALCEAYDMPLSGHCAPALHAPLGCASYRMRHLEYFFDHARIEHLMFDGAPEVRDGSIRPHNARPGFGLVLRERDAAPYRI